MNARIQHRFAFVLALMYFAPVAYPDDAQDLATIRVVDRQGQPLSGERVFVSIQTGQYAPKRLVDGRLSLDGAFVVPRPKNDLDVRAFIVSVGTRNFEVGRFKRENAGETGPIEFMMPPRAGDAAPDIALTGLFTNEPADLSDFRGQVVFLDFWASWCEPCQKPMADNQDIMSRHSSDWEGKAILVALSIDDAQADAARHVESKGWTAIRHFWSAAGSEPGWNSDAPRTYGIDGIPTAFLIDTDGKILWRGNPRQVEVEEMISEQLAR